MLRRVRALGPGEIEEVLPPTPWISKIAKPYKTPQTIGNQDSDCYYYPESNSDVGIFVIWRGLVSGADKFG